MFNLNFRSTLKYENIMKIVFKVQVFNFVKKICLPSISDDSTLVLVLH